MSACLYSRGRSFRLGLQSISFHRDMSSSKVTLTYINVQCDEQNIALLYYFVVRNGLAIGA